MASSEEAVSPTTANRKVNDERCEKPSPFVVNPTTGQITVADPSQLEPGQKWEIEVRATDATGASATATFTINTVASVLLSAIVRLGETIAEGSLIDAVAPPWFEIIELLKRDPLVAYRIDPRKWEEIIAGAYHKAGFEEVILTPRSGDLGRDVIAVKHGLGTVRVIDQVKAFRPGHLVTADDVRALLGVLHADKASKGFLTTTSDFAPKLRDDILLKPFIPAQLELINGKTLLERLGRLATKAEGEAAGGD
ncbi:MAG: restriction endonuclease [Thermoguttaceae bacterium]|jgi:restriction system protein|nr:restriction endonuclease [Thermoguttaceae bacterium]